MHKSFKLPELCYSVISNIETVENSLLMLCWLVKLGCWILGSTVGARHFVKIVLW